MLEWKRSAWILECQRFVFCQVLPVCHSFRFPQITILFKSLFTVLHLKHLSIEPPPVSSHFRRAVISWCHKLNIGVRIGNRWHPYHSISVYTLSYNRCPNTCGNTCDRIEEKPFAAYWFTRGCPPFLNDCCNITTSFFNRPQVKKDNVYMKVYRPKPNGRGEWVQSLEDYIFSFSICTPTHDLRAHLRYCQATSPHQISHLYVTLFTIGLARKFQLMLWMNSRSETPYL